MSEFVFIINKITLLKQTWKMKRAAFALMAVAILSDDVEADVFTAKCKFPDSDEEGAIKGRLNLRLKSDEATELVLSGKIWNADRREDFTAQRYFYDGCVPEAERGPRFGIREWNGSKKSTVVKGWVDYLIPFPLLFNYFGLINMAGELVACCPVSDFEHEDFVDPRRFLDAMVDQN